MSTHSSYNSMKKQLEKCKKLQKWAKEIIQKNYNGEWIYGDGYIRLSGVGRSESDKITFDMIPEILLCFELFGDRMTRLDLGNNNITSIGAILLFDGLKQMNSKIIGIYLDENQLDDECMKSLGEFIQNSKTIESIRIGINKIAHKGIEILSHYLEKNVTLKELYLYSNEGITDKSVPYLIDISNKTEIIILNIEKTSISDEKKGEVNILVAIKNIKSGCDIIDLSFSFIADEGIEILSGHLEGNTTLKQLNLYGNKAMTDKSVPNLIDIAKKSAIISLSIGYTSISDEKQQEIEKLVKAPIDEREIPIQSSSKSAAKTS